MSSPEEINVSFRHQDTDYHISLVKGKQSEHSVEINGFTYTVLEKNNKLKTACEILNSVSLHDISNAEDLRGRLLKRGDLSFPVYKANEVGIDVLHTGAVTTHLDTQKIADTVNYIAKAMRDKYVFVEKGNQCADHLLKQLQNRSYDRIKNPEALAKALTEDLYAITKDKHIGIWQLNSPEQVQIVEVPSDSIPIEEFKDFHPDLIDAKIYVAPTNLGWMGESYLHHEYQSGFLKDHPTIGYFELMKFGVCNDQGTHLNRFQMKGSSELTEDVKARRAAFIDGIQHLKGAKAIIIDLRPNSGGDPSAVQLLCSLFMKENLLLNSLEWRTPDGFETDPFKTLSYEELPDSLRLKDVPLYILGGPNTFSAGEAFMNDMKVHHKKATIVGTQTGGGANPGGMHQVNDLFEIFIPSGRAVNPIQEGNWEGVGITPDHPAKEEQALRTAIELIQSSG